MEQKSNNIKAAAKAYGPEAQRIAGTLLSASGKFSINDTGNQDLDAVYRRFVAHCENSKAFWNRVAAGQNAGAADAKAMADARRLTFLARAIDAAAGNENQDRVARAATIAIAARQLANALKTGKAMQPNKARRTRKHRKAITQFPDVTRMNLPQLQRELKGLTVIKQTAQNAANFCASALQALQAANAMLPEDDLLGQQIKALDLAHKLLQRHENLNPFIQRVKAALKQKEQLAQVPGMVDKLRQGGFQPKPKPKPKPAGLFGGLFSRR